MSNSTAITVPQIRRLKRFLASTNDIYMAKFDVEHQECVPISNPMCGSDVRSFLFLPYQHKPRYEKICRALKRICDADVVTFADLTQGIRSYNSDEIDFSALRKLIGGWNQQNILMYSEILKFMASLALELNFENFERIPLLVSGSNKSLSMSQRQAAILIANCFFCTFQDSTRCQNFNTFNFIQLFSETSFKSVEKLKCILAYFKSIYTTMPTGMITILRQQCPRIRFEDIDPPISDVKVELTGFIEDQFEEAHVDFANNFIGGGVLSSGTVQEEIRFIIAPETLISCLLCEQMSKHEAILILGSQQYSNYTGYSQTFQFKSSKKQPEFKRTELGHYPSCIIAIDAIRYGILDNQFRRYAIDREIRKAFIGFAVKLPDELSSIATGNWGCGAFNGNLELKFLIQLIAASAVGRNLHYFAFGEKKMVENIEFLLLKLKEHNVTFGSLYSRLISGGYNPDKNLMAGPFNYILSTIGCRLPDEVNSEKSTTSTEMEFDHTSIEDSSKSLPSPNAANSISSTNDMEKVEEMEVEIVQVQTCVTEKTESRVKQKAPLVQMSIEMYFPKK